MKNLTKEQLLRNQTNKEFVKHDTRRYVNTTSIFKIEDKEDYVELNYTEVYHKNRYRDEESEREVIIKIKGNSEEYHGNFESLSNVQIDVFEFLHELTLDYLGVVKIFDNGVKVDEKSYTDVIVPFEYREPVTMKLYKVVSSEDLDNILKDGILPISKTGNDNWEDDRRANNSIDVVYLFNPLTEQKNFRQYGDVLLEVETTAYRNEVAPNDANRNKYEEYITYEVKPEEIQFNKQNIEYDTGAAVLIKLPNRSNYKGYKFWHPAKLVREMRKGNGYFLTLSYTDEFVFKVFKTNKKGIRIDSIEFTGDVLSEEFNQLVEDDNESYLEVTEPVKVDRKVEIIKELER